MQLKTCQTEGYRIKAMILCASSESPRDVEPLTVPDGSEIGERAVVEGYDNSSQIPEQLNPKKVSDNCG